MKTRLCFAARQARADRLERVFGQSVLGASRMRRSTVRTAWQPRARYRALGQLEQLVARPSAQLCQVSSEGVAVPSTTGQPAQLRAQHRGVACRVAQAFLLLERGVVLFVHHDQAEPRHRRSTASRVPSTICASPRAASSHACVRAVSCEARCAARRCRAGKCLAEARLELRRQADLGHQR